MRLLKTALGLMVLSLLVGCLTLEGTKVISAIQESLAKVGEKVQPSVVYVEVTPTGENNPSRYTGLIINADGTFILPASFKKGTVQKISVWINKEEIPASLLQTDDRRGLSLARIKIPTSPPSGGAEIKITPLSIEQVASVKPGDWVVGINSAGKELDYQKFQEAGTVKGKQEATLDQILVNGISVGPGTIVVNLDGQVVGIGLGNQIISSYDIKRGVNKILARLAHPLSYEEEKKQPWLGITWEPINEDYATVMNLPKESVLVRTVIQNSPAYEGGLRDEDLIIGVDDQSLTKTGAQLQQQFIKYLDPDLNREVAFKVLRDGTTKTVNCRFSTSPEPKELKAEDIGITVQEITDLEYRGRNLQVKEGVLVNLVIPGSPAATSEVYQKSLINPEDIIVEFNYETVKNLDDFKKALNAIRKEKADVVLIKLWRGNYLTHQALNLKIGRK